MAIETVNLTKKYRIGSALEVNHTLVDTIGSWLKAPFKNYRRIRGLSLLEGENSDNIITALDNVSINIKQGEVVGIIGRNGAGKSTLLKLLSRITKPTSGYATLEGRIASLLEVGTGFHPELTGRENIFLNGTILGMTKSEISKNLNKIIDFSGIEKFLDTPVKRYSSGMRVRLAFSVAAHLEPEILLIDEVLAVGDLEFQKKCLNKMDDISKTGRTVLFVSHNMAAVQSLCSRGILLANGKVVADTSATQAVAEYIKYNTSLIDSVKIFDREDRRAGDIFRFRKVEYLNTENNHLLDIAVSGQNITIKIYYENFSDKVLKDVNIGMSFHNNQGMFLFACGSRPIGVTYDIYPGLGSISCQIKKLPLSAGRLYHSLHCDYNNETLDNLQEAGYIDIEKGDYYGTGQLPGKSQQGILIDYMYKK